MERIVNRRRLIAASATVGSGLLLRSAFAADACGPALAGGIADRSSAPRNGRDVLCQIPALASAARYVTRFDRTENPIDEGGRWVNGGETGLDWHDAKSVNGVAHATALSGVKHRYDDSIAVLKSVFSADQYAQGTVFRSAAYSPPSKHEIELLLRFEIRPHSARGYEVLWGHDGDFAIVRWNGHLGDFTVLAGSGRPALGGRGLGPGRALDGDVLRAEISGNVIRVYKNRGLVFVAPPDATWTTGQPGLGFWPISGSVPQRYGWKAYEAGSL
jgi:hypothetical protein